eukprot:1139539-Pelagomonas_calceolata.AAC.2
MDSCNKPPIISVLGAAGAGKRSLVSSLTGRTSAVGDDGHAPWSIHTKYYSADVAFRVQACGPSPSAPAFEGEAIVLVFDASSQSSFSAIQSWVSSNSESTEEAGVRLVVATHADRYATCCASTTPCSRDAQPHPQATSSQETATCSTLSRPQWLRDAMDWCAGECFEYVECCNTDAALDQQLRLEGDMQGIARITEALQAHMWPGLVMREPAGRTSKNLHQSSQGLGTGGDKGSSSTTEAGAGVEERLGPEHPKHLLPSQSTDAPPRVLSPPCANRGQEEDSGGDVDPQMLQPFMDGKQQQEQGQQQQQGGSQSDPCQGAQHHSHSQSTSKPEDLDGWERLMEQMAGGFKAPWVDLEWSCQAQAIGMLC